MVLELEGDRRNISKFYQSKILIHRNAVIRLLNGESGGVLHYIFVIKGPLT